MSRLDLVVGPNGAGKSTFIRKVIVPAWPAAKLVNADEIAAHKWPRDPMGHAYEAAAIAAATRDRLIHDGVPLIAETVFSHPSKLELIVRAKAAGYFVSMQVLMVPEELAVWRVAYRVRSGGHDVPVDKIRQRHRRLWSNVAAATAMVDQAMFWDNSEHDGPRAVAVFSDGFPAGAINWPVWASRELIGLTPAWE